MGRDPSFNPKMVIKNQGQRGLEEVVFQRWETPERKLNRDFGVPSDLTTDADGRVWSVKAPS